MPPAIDYGCANCGAELNPGKTPERREVPRRGGRNLPVCDGCAREIDAQQTLDVERVSMSGIALAEIGTYYPRDRCVWCGAHCKREKLRRTVVKTTLARALECDNRKRCMQRQRAKTQAA